MKTLTLLLAVAVAGSAAVAQDKPLVASASPAKTAASPAAIKQFVYLAKLPTPADLISDAQAQGITVSRIEQSDDRIVVVYQYADGSSQTYAYKLLSSAGGSTATAPAVENMTVVSAPPPPPPPRVVYVEREPVYYSGPRYVRYYDPVWDFWAPVSLGIGLGWNIGGHGFYRGGFSGGHDRHGGHRH